MICREWYFILVLGLGGISHVLKTKKIAMGLYNNNMNTIYMYEQKNVVSNGKTFITARKCVCVCCLCKLKKITDVSSQSIY